MYRRFLSFAVPRFFLCFRSFNCPTAPTVRSVAVWWLSAAIVVGSDAVLATTVVSFDFDAAAGDFDAAAEFAVPNLTVSKLSDRDGTLTGFAGNPLNAAGAKSWHDGNAFMFTIDVEQGYRLTLDGFSFDERASLTGPAEWSLSVGGIPLASGLTTTSFSNQAAPFVLSDLTGSLEIALAARGASSSSGTWRIDNFAFSGDVRPVPLPPAMGLFSVACMSVLVLGRKRAPAGTPGVSRNQAAI